jgi:hypothetical protein
LKNDKNTIRQAYYLQCSQHALTSMRPERNLGGRGLLEGLVREEEEGGSVLALLTDRGY